LLPFHVSFIKYHSTARLWRKPKSETFPLQTQAFWHASNPGKTVHNPDMHLVTRGASGACDHYYFGPQWNLGRFCNPFHAVQLYTNRKGFLVRRKRLDGQGTTTRLQATTGIGFILI
jgi:hypothetical protein